MQVLLSDGQVDVGRLPDAQSQLQKSETGKVQLYLLRRGTARQRQLSAGAF